MFLLLKIVPVVHQELKNLKVNKPKKEILTGLILSISTWVIIRIAFQFPGHFIICEVLR